MRAAVASAAAPDFDALLAAGAARVRRRPSEYEAELREIVGGLDAHSTGAARRLALIVRAVDRLAAAAVEGAIREGADGAVVRDLAAGRFDGLLSQVSVARLLRLSAAPNG